jgi:hypothetical protein
MDDDKLMYVLEAMAYISATFAAFVYVWETCSPRKRRIIKHHNRNSSSSIHEDKLINHGNNSRKSSSSLYDDF